MRPRYYKRDGTPYEGDGLLAWAGDLEAAHAVGLTMIGDVKVSTVWLGLDHQFGDGPPLIFETMVFGGTLHESQERYSTEAEATAGHAAWCERVRKVNA